jgi:hypothetical protein
MVAKAKKTVEAGSLPRMEVQITAPRFQTAEFLITGTSPYVQQAWSTKAIQQIKDTQTAGSQAKSKKTREPKDFQKCYEEAIHRSTEGWAGFPASAIRAAMISACRLVAFKMTLAKMSIFTEPDGFDKVDGQPLVKITKGDPAYCEHMVRIQQTCDLRSRAMWQPGWQAKVRIRFDLDQFSLTDVTNLLHRVGQQVGLGEGRADSRSSTGMGWGFFSLQQT